MLQWMAASLCARFALIVHHTDADREVAYDWRLDKALDEANAKCWAIVSMKDDWTTISPPAK